MDPRWTGTKSHLHAKTRQWLDSDITVDISHSLTGHSDAVAVLGP